MRNERLPVEHHALRALIVDADADTRSLYHTALTLAGWEVVEAPDGRDAMTKALTEPPMLVITEWRLPFVDGLALCHVLHRDAATCAVPILVVTAEARSSDLERLRRAGADAVLVKPTAPDAIVREAERLVAQSASAHESDPAGELAATPLPAPSGKRRQALVRSHARFKTTTPPLLPPQLTCPSCDQSMHYGFSQIGGVSDRHPEQWDYYDCPRCGTFQYRQRTRRIRRIP
ncbi:MAG TPA: response regulator [Vicinamibacterales bacterium]|nr:response regulator [Vicinamibacterales bacterium]